MYYLELKNEYATSGLLRLYAHTFTKSTTAFAVVLFLFLLRQFHYVKCCDFVFAFGIVMTFDTLLTLLFHINIYMHDITSVMFD
jgi:hypothetical protein